MPVANRVSNRHTAADRAVAPFSVVEDLKVPCGYERSFKFVDKHILANRYLLAIDRRQLTHRKLESICDRLVMPTEYVEALQANIDDANLVYLGFEESIGYSVYKLYVEFYTRANRSRVDAPGEEPYLLHLGFKWNADTGDAQNVARYHWYPELNSGAIRSRVHAACAGTDSVVRESVGQIFRIAEQRADPQTFLFLDVEEGERHSFDLNVYTANLIVSDIDMQLRTLADQFDIPSDQFERLWPLVAAKPLGHISAGTSRSGRNFVTVYYEA